MVLVIKKINHKLKLPLPGSTNTNLGANKSKKTVMYLKKKKKHQSVKPPTEVLKAGFKAATVTVWQTWKLIGNSKLLSAPRPIESEPLGLGYSNLGFNKLAKCYWHSLEVGELLHWAENRTSNVKCSGFTCSLLRDLN